MDIIAYLNSVPYFRPAAFALAAAAYVVTLVAPAGSKAALVATEALKIAAFLGIGFGASSGTQKASVQSIPPKAVALILALGVAVAATPARASGFDWSAGPTLPLMEVRTGYAHPLSLAPGAGVQFSVTNDAWKKAFFGKSWDLLDLSGLAFGTSVSTSSGATFGALSLAVGLCTMSSLICAGVGHDLVAPAGASSGWFGLFALSFNFALSPVSPPAGVESGAAGLPRANTIYLGAP